MMHVARVEHVLRVKQVMSVEQVRLHTRINESAHVFLKYVCM